MLNYNLRAERGFGYKGSDVAAMIGDVSRPSDGWRHSPGRPGLPPQSLFFLNSLTIWRQSPSPGVGGAGHGGWGLPLHFLGSSSIMWASFPFAAQKTWVKGHR